MLDRRTFLARFSSGFGAVALAQLEARASGHNPLAPKPPQLPAKAKAVISIFCYGGVSQVDTFDPKPMLFKRQGEQMTGVGEVRPTMGTPGGLMPSPWEFRKRGHCGMEISELFPHVAEHADDLALIRSMYAQSSAHGPAAVVQGSGDALHHMGRHGGVDLAGQFDEAGRHPRLAPHPGQVERIDRNAVPA